MKKRILSIVLMCCMLLTLCPITVFAEGGTEEMSVCGEEGGMPQTQSDAVPAQMSGGGEGGIAVQSAGVAINPTNFPDANFRSFVAEKYDTDGDNYLSDTEIAAVDNISCQNKNIRDLTGVGYFTAMTTLLCYGNQLTSLDVSNNTAVEHLDCSDNQLTTLNVSNNTVLKYLNCYKNQLTTLDVSNDTALKSLDCHKNQLNMLDVSNNTVLEALYCYDNQLTTLDVSNNTALKSLDCHKNQLTTLDVSNNTGLKELDCYENQLTTLDVSNNAVLTTLYCYTNQLTSLDISGNTKLSALSSYPNTYQIALDENRTFDLSTLPGSFDVTKASNWRGGTVSGSTLTVDNDKNTVTYRYDCGNGKDANFTLKCTQIVHGLGLYVNGEQFTDKKLSIACGEGTAIYDPDTKTLTLNNATITKGGKSDENPKYGIRVVGDTDLTIKLSGTNSIALANGGGIFADGSSDNYNIIGDGKLTIDVKWDALYTLNGNISISEGAELDIKSAEGNGIMSYNKGNISIDGAKVRTFAYYSAANAKELEVKNDSEVVLSSSADQFNAVYMGDGNGAGKIEIIKSKVEATSYYPALYTEGTLTVNGGEVKCTSTADAAIWTIGDILVKGGAKVTTDGKYPMGGAGTFTVEEAEIDAKNTNTRNVSAIYDKCVPVVADGYQLTYAKAVDSEGTGIDLLSSGNQYFAFYKNVHFITKAVYPVSVVVTPDELTNVVVKVNGQAVTNPVHLVAGTYQLEVTADNCKAYSGTITVTDDAATHTQTIAMTYLPADYTKVDEAIAKANALNKNDYKDFSDVEAAVNAVVRGKNITEQSEVDKMAKVIEDAIASLETKPANTTPGTTEQSPGSPKPSTEKQTLVTPKPNTEKQTLVTPKPNTEGQSPQTGDTGSLALWIALLFVSGGAVIGTTAVTRKKTNSVK